MLDVRRVTNPHDAVDLINDIAALMNIGQFEVNSLANAAGQTLTVAQVMAGVLLRSGAAAVSDTTPTEAALLEAFGEAEVGAVRLLLIRNNNSGTLTIVAGSGVTLEGTTTIAAGNARLYAVRKTAADAITISGLMVAAV